MMGDSMEWLDTALQALYTEVTAAETAQLPAAFTRAWLRLRIGLAQNIAVAAHDARLDEHQLLATLDESGRKQRYLDLANE